MEVAQTPNTEDGEKVSASTPVTLTPELKKEKSSKNGYIIGILLFLIVCLIGGLAYFVLKDNEIEISSTKENANSDTNVNNTTPCPTDIDTPATPTTTNDCSLCSNNTNSTCELSVVNEGWSLFSALDYKFSVEVPSYTMTQKIGTEDVDSIWKVGHSTTVDGYSLYPNYLHTVNIAFYPSYIPKEGSECGRGCLQEHSIAVNIYRNDGSKDLNTVKSAYSANWISKLSSADDLTGNTVTKWGKNVWEFTASREGGSTTGYLVVTNNYVYEISYFFSTTPATSYQIALKVLDSMKFEE